MPPQWGRQVVITGATEGLGYQTALALAGAGAQVVNLSSLAHRFGASIHFDDLNGQQGYKAFAACGPTGFMELKGQVGAGTMAERRFA